ncbi:hypothetical protein ACIPSA_48305 [Streptomyces sp. NPDC086549]|uniref:hypothetical protein n=1 Tax=Streptomyces sp. NPDC086549 TaxID=3365752 RepID=UPI0037F59BFF
MDANTVTAICATAIATASFGVSIQQGRIARQHNRHSVAPVLEIWTKQRLGGRTGISLANHGLGPAFVTRSNVWLDGVHLGNWGGAGLEAIRNAVRERPAAMGMTRRPWAIPAGTSRFLLHVENYDSQRNGDLWHLIRHRLAVEITYESIYGESYMVSRHPEDGPPL